MGESGGVGFEACVMAVRQKLRGVTGLDLKRVDREIPLVRRLGHCRGRKNSANPSSADLATSASSIQGLCTLDFRLGGSLSPSAD